MSYWEDYLEPIKYTDDIYHVGARSGPCWVVKSTDGLILIDTAKPQHLYQIIINLNKLGLDYRDIKHIIHSHGHIDHIGGTRPLVELTGAKTYIGRGDVPTVKGENDLQWTKQFNIPFEVPFTPDVIIDDGDKITIGDKTFEFYNTPGHTFGTLTFFFNCTDKGKTYRAGSFGGAGLNTMSKAYMDKYNIDYSIRQEFIDGMDKMMDENVEVHLGNHLGDNKHKEKLALIGGEKNPFIDTTTWKWFLEKRKAEAIDFFEKDPV